MPEQSDHILTLITRCAFLNKPVLVSHYYSYCLKLKKLKRLLINPIGELTCVQTNHGKVEVVICLVVVESSLWLLSPDKRHLKLMWLLLCTSRDFGLGTQYCQLGRDNLLKDK